MVQNFLPMQLGYPQPNGNPLLPNSKRNFRQFAPILSENCDPLKPLQEKMQEYIDSGTRLGWLINRKQRQVEIYR
jgi:hypothetical protein